MLKATRFTLFAAAACLLLSYQNCSQANFASTPGLDASEASSSSTTSTSSTNSPSLPPTPGSSCQLQTIEEPVKILFIVDISGSNSTPSTDNGTLSCTSSNTASCTPATDPNKTFRKDSITDFFALYSQKTNVEWGFEVFSDSASQLLGASTAFGTAAVMPSVFSKFSSDADGGGTQYLKALSSATQAITSDPDKSASPAPIYEVVFMSDGYPGDVSPVLSANGALNSQLAAAVAKLKAAASKVTLNTIYYSVDSDPTAVNVLSQMATLGGGVAATANVSSIATININDVIQVSCPTSP